MITIRYIYKSSPFNKFKRKRTRTRTHTHIAEVSAEDTNDVEVEVDFSLSDIYDNLEGEDNFTAEDVSEVLETLEDVKEVVEDTMADAVTDIYDNIEDKVATALTNKNSIRVKLANLAKLASSSLYDLTDGVDNDWKKAFNSFNDLLPKEQSDILDINTDTNSNVDANGQNGQSNQNDQENGDAQQKNNKTLPSVPWHESNNNSETSEHYKNYVLPRALLMKKPESTGTGKPRNPLNSVTGFDEPIKNGELADKLKVYPTRISSGNNENDYINSELPDPESPIIKTISKIMPGFKEAQFWLSQAKQVQNIGNNLEDTTEFKRKMEESVYVDGKIRNAESLGSKGYPAYLVRQMEELIILSKEGQKNSEQLKKGLTPVEKRTVKESDQVEDLENWLESNQFESDPAAMDGAYTKVQHFLDTTVNVFLYCLRFSHATVKLSENYEKLSIESYNTLMDYLTKINVDETDTGFNDEEEKQEYINLIKQSGYIGIIKFLKDDFAKLNDAIQTKLKINCLGQTVNLGKDNVNALINAYKYGIEETQGLDKLDAILLRGPYKPSITGKEEIQPIIEEIRGRLDSFTESIQPLINHDITSSNSFIDTTLSKSFTIAQSLRYFCDVVNRWLVMYDRIITDAGTYCAYNTNYFSREERGHQKSLQLPAPTIIGDLKQNFLVSKSKIIKDFVKKSLDSIVKNDLKQLREKINDVVTNGVLLHREINNMKELTLAFNKEKDPQKRDLCHKSIKLSEEKMQKLNSIIAAGTEYVRTHIAPWMLPEGGTYSDFIKRYDMSSEESNELFKKAYDKIRELNNEYLHLTSQYLEVSSVNKATELKSIYEAARDFMIIQKNSDNSEETRMSALEFFKNEGIDTSELEQADDDLVSLGLSFVNRISKVDTNIETLLTELSNVLPEDVRGDFLAKHKEIKDILMKKRQGHYGEDKPSEEQQEQADKEIMDVDKLVDNINSGTLESCLRDGNYFGIAKNFKIGKTISGIEKSPYIIKSLFLDENGNILDNNPITGEAWDDEDIFNLSDDRKPKLNLENDTLIIFDGAKAAKTFKAAGYTNLTKIIGNLTGYDPTVYICANQMLRIITGKNYISFAETNKVLENDTEGNYINAFAKALSNKNVKDMGPYASKVYDYLVGTLNNNADTDADKDKNTDSNTTTVAKNKLKRHLLRFAKGGLN